MACTTPTQTIGADPVISFQDANESFMPLATGDALENKFVAFQPLDNIIFGGAGEHTIANTICTLGIGAKRAIHRE